MALSEGWGITEPESVGLQLQGSVSVTFMGALCCSWEKLRKEKKQKLALYMREASKARMRKESPETRNKISDTELRVLRLELMNGSTFSE